MCYQGQTQPQAHNIVPPRTSHCFDVPAAKQDLTNVDFPYDTLDEETDQVRLLIIDRLDESDEPSGVKLYCTLHSSSLTAVVKDEYFALSYTWGNGEAVHEILVNGRVFKVRWSLFDFLCTIGVQQYARRPIFIDAVCINQASLAERAHQVQLMGKIYSGAKQVVAWLEPTPPFDRLAIARYTLPMRDLVPPESRSSVWTRTELEVKSSILDQRPDMLSIIGMTMWCAFWTRVWIVQEIMLARDLVLFVGDKSLNPRILVDWKMSTPQATDAFGQKYGTHGDTVYDATMRATFEYIANFRVGAMLLQWQSLRRRVQAANDLPLYEILAAFCGHQCSEPRDMVFGFLGIANSKIVPNYDVAVSELYHLVLIEGLWEIAKSFDLDSGSLEDRERAQARQLGFIACCMRAFRFSATNGAVLYTIRRAFLHFGVVCRPGEADHCELEFARSWGVMLSHERGLLQPLPAELRAEVWGRFPKVGRLPHHTQQMVASLSPKPIRGLLGLLLTDTSAGNGSRINEAAEFLHHGQQMMVCCLPEPLRGLAIASRWAYGDVRHGLQSGLLGLFERVDRPLSMPDGHCRTCRQWTNEVDRISRMVVDEHALICSSTNPVRLEPGEYAGVLNTFMAHPEIFGVIDWCWQILLSTCLAWLGVMLGAWLDSRVSQLCQAGLGIWVMLREGTD